MKESTRVYIATQLLDWNSIPLIVIGGFTTLSFSMGGFLGTVPLGLGIYALIASSRLKSVPSSQWSHSIMWSMLMGVATAVLIYFCVTESYSWLSITLAILLIQLLVASGVLFLSIGNNRGSGEGFGFSGNVR